jgi:hypothetical protein
LKKHSLLVAVCLLFMTVTAAYGQRVDLGFGAGTVTGPSNSFDSLGNFTPSFGRGTYLSFSGNVLLFHGLGFNGEVSWRATRAKYPTFLFGDIPYRPLFYDFNALWAPKYGRVGPELMAGIGAESLRFYTGQTTCNGFSCTNYQSSNHFAGHFGGGLKLYVRGGFFVRPEGHIYLIRNNQEFNGSYIGRFGASIGYSFGGQ